MIENNNNNGDGMHNGQSYHSFTVKEKEVSEVVNGELNEPPYDMEYLRAIAATKGASGETDVRDFLMRTHSKANSQVVERGTALKALLTQNILGLERKISEGCKLRDQTSPYFETTNAEPVPWSLFARIEVALFVFFSAAVLLFGMNSTAQILHSSGISGFESWWRCYLASMIPAMLAVALKGLHKTIKDPTRKKQFMVTTLILGICFGIVWLIIFAQLFPAMTQTTAQIINSISSQPSRNDTGGVNWTYIVVIAPASAPA